MKKSCTLIGFTAILLLASSCVTRKNIAYLQDMVQGEKYLYDSKYESIVHINDRLSITVTCKQPELAIPFNAQSGSVRISSNGEPTSGTLAGPTVTEKGYRVGADGTIDFPILGKLKVEGLKVTEVTDLIKNKIIEGNYIKDPQVSLEFLNFKYTVLGAVGHTGTFTVNDDRITLLEAIANAGDLATKAKINSVKVIREVNGEREIYVHDLRSKELFTSPCFYLQQNDIVYVEPKYLEKNKSEKSIQYTSILLSLASVIISAFWLLK